MAALLCPVPVPTASPLRVSIIVLAYRHVENLTKCLESLRKHVPPDIAHETIVFSNGLGVEALIEVQRRFPNVRLRFSPVNLGFAGGCNSAARHACGEYLVLLNDDAEVEPGWLESLIDAFELEPGVGAVGSRILRPDGSVQESGSVIWSDGFALGVGRDLPEDTGQYSYRRQVDYCSAASLLIPRDVWNDIGGMDEEYHPAYYEDVDLCFTLRARGLKVIYEPRARIRHTESSSTDEHFRRFLFDRNRRRLREKWATELADCEPPPTPGNRQAGIARALRRAAGWRRRILVVDDCYPERSLGAGLGKMLSVIEELSEFAAVSFLSTAGMGGDPSMLHRLGVEVVEEPLDVHVRRPDTLYSVIVVSRPHNFDRYEAVLRRWQPQAPIVYDAEALFHVRLLRQAAVSGDAAITAEAEAMQQMERRISVQADRIVCISADEAELVGAVPGHAPVDIVEPRRLGVRWTEPGFAERRDAVLVAGWLSGPMSPNVDGLVWFANEVVPYLVKRLPWARVRVTGGCPPETVTCLAGPAIQFIGHVADLDDVYSSARVAIVPLRFGAGVKIKAIEALLHGLPVVATTCGGEGINVLGRPVIDVADDPEAFADRLATLLDDPAVWEKRRESLRSLIDVWDSTPARPWRAVIEETLIGRR
jgi:GT2 family glycosyltransferase